MKKETIYIVKHQNAKLDDEIICLMIDNMILINRPIKIKNYKTFIVRDL